MGVMIAGTYTGCQVRLMVHTGTIMLAAEILMECAWLGLLTVHMVEEHAPHEYMSDMPAPVVNGDIDMNAGQRISRGGDPGPHPALCTAPAQSALYGNYTW
jgi:hypothetical protein